MVVSIMHFFIKINMFYYFKCKKKKWLFFGKVEFLDFSYIIYMKSSKNGKIDFFSFFPKKIEKVTFFSKQQKNKIC